MPGHLISPDNQQGVCPVVIGETWIRLLSKCMMKIMGNKATKTCQDDKLCARLKAGIEGAVHRVQSIWDSNSFTKNWVFLLVDAKNTFNEINCIEMIWVVSHLWLSRDHIFT